MRFKGIEGTPLLKEVQGGDEEFTIMNDNINRLLCF